MLQFEANHLHHLDHTSVQSCKGSTIVIYVILYSQISRKYYSRVLNTIAILSDWRQSLFYYSPQTQDPEETVIDKKPNYYLLIGSVSVISFVRR